MLFDPATKRFEFSPGALQLCHSRFLLRAVKMKIFLFVCLAISGVASEISERQCIESLFHNVKLTSRSEIEACDKVKKNFTAEFTSNIMARLVAEDDQTCILRTFDQYHINDVYLKGLIRHLYNDKLNNDEYEDDVDESVEALLKAVKVLCVAGNKYAKEFDESIESHKQNNNTNDFDAELCARKYMFDKRIIDPAEYNVSPIVNVTDCEKVYEGLEDSFSIHDDETQKPNTFFGLSATKAQDCTRQKFEKEKLLQKIFSFNVIVHFDLTNDQVKALRTKYVSWMSSSVRFLLECIKEII